MINTMEINPDELAGLDLFQNCRLCLAKEKVSVDIFSDGAEVRLLYYKIISCLPVQVTQEDDKLPKKICMTCNEKVDTFYQFWTLTAKTQKTLIDWAQQKDVITTKIKTENVPPGEMSFKQETIDYSDDNDNDDHYDDDNSDDDVEPSAIVKVCEETDEAGTSATAHIKSSGQTTMDKITAAPRINDKDLKVCEFDLSIIKHSIHSDQAEKSVEVTPQFDLLRCKGCGFVADTLTNSYHHSIECRKQQKIFQCSICNKQCLKKKDLKQHMIVHTDERPYSCDICNISFKRRFQWNKHNQVVHKKAKKETCKICGWAAKSKKKLQMHKKTCVTNVYQCDICKKMFGAKSLLMYHMIAHSSERPYPCDMCGATFKHKRNVHKHISDVHSNTPKPPKLPPKPGEKKKLTGQCEICGKSFFSRYGHASHIKKIHGDGKPKCPICGKAVSCRKGLVIHMNTHTGQKPYCCEICGKAFTTKDYLKIHNRVHTGECPFKCHVCPKSFKQKCSLNQHYRTNHPGIAQPKKVEEPPESI